MILTAVALPVVCLAQPLPTFTLPADIALVLRDYERAWSANDPDALSRLFVPEGLALLNGAPPALGADSIRKSCAQSAGTPLALRPYAFGSSGDLAYVVGGFGPSADKADLGKFTLVLRRSASGRWLVAADMDNTNAPLPPAAKPRPAGP